MACRLKIRFYFVIFFLISLMSQFEDPILDLCLSSRFFQIIPSFFDRRYNTQRLYIYWFVRYRTMRYRGKVRYGGTFFRINSSPITLGTSVLLYIFNIYLLYFRYIYVVCIVYYIIYLAATHLERAGWWQTPFQSQFQMNKLRKPRHHMTLWRTNESRVRVDSSVHTRHIN